VPIELSGCESSASTLRFNGLDELLLFSTLSLPPHKAVDDVAADAVVAAVLILLSATFFIASSDPRSSSSSCDGSELCPFWNEFLRLKISWLELLLAVDACCCIRKNCRSSSSFLESSDSRFWERMCMFESSCKLNF